MTHTETATSARYDATCGECYGNYNTAEPHDCTDPAQSGYPSAQAYEAYRADVALDARWMVWPSCSECHGGPSKPCRRTCSQIARIYSTR